MECLKDAIEDFRNGKFLIVVDDENRENEGDLVIAAEKIRPEDVNFMITHCKGLLCMPMLAERLDELDIPLMVKNNTEKTRCQFTVSVDHKDSGTGISAYSRALTIKKLIDEKSLANDFNRPGHVFPLRCNPGGVLERQGHTEASIELCRLSGLYLAGVICEIISPDGKMARMPELEKFSEEHGIRIVKICDIVEYLNDRQ